MEIDAKLYTYVYVYTHITFDKHIVKKENSKRQKYVACV